MGPSLGAGSGDGLLMVISTHYLYTIYTLSIQYLYSIYRVMGLCVPGAQSRCRLWCWDADGHIDFTLGTATTSTMAQPRHTEQHPDTEQVMHSVKIYKLYNTD